MARELAVRLRRPAVSIEARVGAEPGSDPDGEHDHELDDVVL